MSVTSACLVLLLLLSSSLPFLLSSSSSLSSLLFFSFPPRPPYLPCHFRRPRRPRLIATRDRQYSLPDLNYDHLCPIFPAGPQLRPSTPSCRTLTTTIHAQYSLPDLNYDHLRPVFPAGP